MGRRYKNASAPEGVVFLNYAQSKAQLPKAEDVPTLVPAQALTALTNGDAEPFYKIEAIDFPANGSGGVYEGSFFESFINVTKNRPIPGSKRGHEWVSRPASDFYTVGGRVDSLDKGKTGTAYLKVYIPPMGDPTENAAFRRDAQANMVHFSLVTRPDFNMKTEKDEMENNVQVRHFTASMGYERNDAMEYGAGAMPQVVNSESMDYAYARSLIAEGKFDNNTKVEGSPIQHDRVYRSALRVMLSRANESERHMLSELVSMIDRASNGRKQTVETKEEAITLLGNLIANGREKIGDVAKALGFGDKLRNEQDEANAETIKTLNSKLGDKPLEKLDAILAENAANAAFAVEKAVAEIAGPAKTKNAKGDDVPNPAHSYAAKACAGLTGEALKNGVEALKTDPVMITLNAARADGNSPLNRVEHGGRTETTENSAGDGIPTISMKRKEA
jgi:hypothetical protein